MSKFKRSFFSPHQIYKSLHSSSPSLNVDPSSGPESCSKLPGQLSGLHLCRGTSVVCERLEVAKENKPPLLLNNTTTHTQQSILQFISEEEEPAGGGIVTVEYRRSKARIVNSSETTRSIGSREPLAPLSGNVPVHLNPPGSNILCDVDSSTTYKIPKQQLRSHVLCENHEDDDNKDEDSSLFVTRLAPPRPLHVWDDVTNYDAAPLSAWSSLGNRYLLCRPLPIDIGRCACYIVRERDGSAGDGPIVYALYTDEGHGRQDRKLAVARHRRRSGRSEFVINQNGARTFLDSQCEEGFLGQVTANIVGSRYSIWNEVCPSNGSYHRGRHQLGVVMFEPTITTFTGAFKVMRVYVPKNQPLHLNTVATTQNETVGLPKDWEENSNKVYELCSRKPHYNRVMRRYELDYRDRTRGGYKIQTSSKNFQLVMEEHGKQVILQHGKLGNSKYFMEYRFPLNAYQAFGICLASIDSKLCCSV